ncbi:MAG: hypothetical protein ACRDN0_29225 [Trebonia sp.]
MVAAAAAILVVGGGMAAYGSTVGFGDNQVGTQYPNGIQVSDDQIINPIGDRLLTDYGKFMGSTVSPDGQFLAATSTDHTVVLQIFNLKTYKLIWTVGTATGANQILSDGTVGQEGPARRSASRSPRWALTFRVTPGLRRPTPRWSAR